MLISTAEFIKSAPGLKDCPDPAYPEYAFIGRSNVGKSSLLNMIVDRKTLAKTSGKPGKTRLINFFLINETWHLVDLPGYGYAVASKKDRALWDKMVRDYLLKRKSLMYVFQLIDCRVPPQKSDIESVNWMGEKQIPFVIVFTKADKLPRLKLEKSVKAFKNELSKNWTDMPHMVTTSAVSRKGKEEILGIIEETNQAINPALFKFNK